MTYKQRYNRMEKFCCQCKLSRLTVIKLLSMTLMPAPSQSDHKTLEHDFYACIQPVRALLSMHGALTGRVCQFLATGQWFSLGTPVSSTNKTYNHNITEILLFRNISSSVHFNYVFITLISYYSVCQLCLDI